MMFSTRNTPKNSHYRYRPLPSDRHQRSICKNSTSDDGLNYFISQYPNASQHKPLTRKKIKPQKPIRFIHLMNFSLRCCSILSDIPDTFWQSYKLSLHCHEYQITIYGTFITISGTFTNSSTQSQGIFYRTKSSLYGLNTSINTPGSRHTAPCTTFGGI